MGKLKWARKLKDLPRFTESLLVWNSISTDCNTLKSDNPNWLPKSSKNGKQWTKMLNKIFKNNISRELVKVFLKIHLAQKKEINKKLKRLQRKPLKKYNHLLVQLEEQKKLRKNQRSQVQRLESSRTSHHQKERHLLKSSPILNQNKKRIVNPQAKSLLQTKNNLHLI